MEYFKRTTMDVPKNENVQNAVIMGRNTWNSLPKHVQPLPHRKNIVLSRQSNLQLPKNVLQAQSLTQAHKVVNSFGDSINKVYLIGGEELYRQAFALNYVKRVLLTEVHGLPSDAIFDAYFPNIIDQGWVVEKVIGGGIDKKSDLRYTFLSYIPS
uniref:dihydrofolate reductase n=2 Tax=Leptocylindrus danicus TaxID=163516 RepID=A0A7S2LNK2_9STRA|mmetsp:Transcript_7760/g.11529  ORF Transcript_7760/g.11529 Transcript_7760/m.11529 type:complete len:155 (+) Transcript_7760:37-501(+)